MEWAARLAALTIASTALTPTPLIAARPKWIFPSLATRKSTCPSLILGRSTSIPIRRQSSICSTKNLSLSAPSISDESNGRHELGWIVGFQVSGLKGNQCIGCAVRLVEAVATEMHDQLEYLGGLVAVESLLACEPSMNWSRLLAIVSAFFFEIALMVAYAVDSSMPPRRFKIRMTCS